MIFCVSTKDWKLEPATEKNNERLKQIGLDRDDIELRCRENTYTWLMRQFNHEIGAFYGYYNPQIRQFTEPQTANIIAPWQLIAAYDRYQDENLLNIAKRCCEWLHNNFVDNHPMSLVLGGIRDNLKPNQLWTKYTADYVITNLGIYERTKEEQYLERAIQSNKFLLQAKHHLFSPMYDRWQERWLEKGWRSFGRIICANLALYHYTEKEEYLRWATAWAEYCLKFQSGDGCFFLVHDNYYSSDVAADEIRGLANLYLLTKRQEFLDSAIAFSDWHLEHQLKNGAWPLSIDTFGIKISEYVGPGDAPNIAIALLMMHKITKKIEYLVSALRAIKYILPIQYTPENRQHFPDDENLLWGFWSWQPYYDYTMSSDQSTHHVRGLWFFIDYFSSLSQKTQNQLISKLKEGSKK